MLCAGPIHSRGRNLDGIRDAEQELVLSSAQVHAPDARVIRRKHVDVWIGNACISGFRAYVVQPPEAGGERPPGIGDTQ